MARAESLRFESAWAGEQVLGSVPHLDPIEVLLPAPQGGDDALLRQGAAVVSTTIRGLTDAQLAKSGTRLIVAARAAGAYHGEDVASAMAAVLRAVPSGR